MLRGRDGVTELVVFEKPVVKVKVDVADVNACDKLAGWTPDVRVPSGEQEKATRGRAQHRTDCERRNMSKLKRMRKAILANVRPVMFV